MIQPTAVRRLRRPVMAALLAATMAAGILPGPSAASARPLAAEAPRLADVATDAVPADAAAAADSVGGSLAVNPAATSSLDGAPDAAAPGNTAASGNAAAPGAGAADASTGQAHPSTAYEEWLAHEHDRIAFTPGGRVTVGFTPRAGDTWTVGGVAPAALPSGRVTGSLMAAASQGSVWSPGAAGSPADAGTPSRAPADATTLQPAAVGITVAPAATTALRRQVFGFLPYWELSGASTSLNYGVLSTIAYFSVGADGRGNLRKRNSDGTLTTGWAGWSSSSMTSVINAAHQHGTRVVLTASVFAWTSSGATVQRALLASSTARLNLAKQLAAAVRDRGADGVNLDFEPLVSGQEANFVALLKTLRTQLNAIRSGYQITYDTTGFIGNYPLAASVGPAAADAVFIMGYDYRTDSASTSGSIDPLSGPTYDLADTVREYISRISPSRVILGVPWYGRAWSTATSAPRSANRSGLKYGYSTAVNYENIPALVAKYGRKWDAVEQSPYIAYQRRNCTTTYGCVTSWRQVWYDDAVSLQARYQLVSDYGLRGAGIWALGYAGSYPDMERALSDAFLVDHAAPRAGITALPAKDGDEGFVVSWSADDVSAVSRYDVQVATDGGAWTAWRTGTSATSDVWLGADGHGYAFRVRATDAKGNVGPWNVTAASAATPASLAVGGFARVTYAGLAYRTGPATSAARLGSLARGTIVALTAGPVSAGGYTWYEVTQPIHEWAPVSFVERGVWIAVRSSTTTYAVPSHAPNTTIVDAVISGFDFSGGGAVGAVAAALAGRAFSPNGDGAQDGLRLRWTNTVALSALQLNVLRLDGTLVGSVAVPGRAVGARAWIWNGAVGGRKVADGRYLLQLAGTVGTRTYYAPSASPATAAQIAAYAVTVDTVAPTISSASISSALISPNGDGRRETTAFALSSPGAASWRVEIAVGSAAPVRTYSGSGPTLAVTWDGRSDGGTVVADAVYTASLAACDVAGNCAARPFTVRVDTTPAAVVVTSSPPVFSPNGDSAADRVTLRWTSSESAGGTVAVWRGTTLVRRWTVRAALAGSVLWDGRNTAGTVIADGRYTVKVDVRDAAGNRTVASTTVVSDRTAGLLRWSRAFYPQDRDALAPTSVVSFRLTRTATTTLELYDASGTLVRTVWTARRLAAGTRTWTWDGKLADGTFVAQGFYSARLTVISPYSTQTLTRAVAVAAFPGRLSAATVRAGQTLTVSFTTTEPLRTAPRVTFRQPGLAAVTITATKLTNGSYRARFAVHGTTAGAGSIRIAATDTGGHANVTLYALAVAR